MIPPEVEPEHPHTIDATTRRTMENDGHILVSAVAKPVVVVIEQTWNVAGLSALMKGIPSFRLRLKAMAADITDRKPRKASVEADIVCGLFHLPRTNE